MNIDIISKLHKKTQRDYLGRMTKEKPGCMRVARRFGKMFFDGDRDFGYGGYEYDGRFKAVAKALKERYGLNEDSTILDYGCAKGFLMYDLNELLKLKQPCAGIDISDYAKDEACVGGMIDFWPSEQVDLIVSLGTLHNLTLPSLKTMVQKIEMTATHKYITVDSYRTARELFNLQCWTLTCEQFFRPEEWEMLFKEWGYTGDYEFLFFT